MPRAKSISKVDNEREDKPKSALRRSSRNKSTESTPLRPTLDTLPTASTTSSSSSSSSSSSANSIFDRSAKNLDTPLSTPIPEDSSSTEGKDHEVITNLDAPPLSLEEKFLKHGIPYPTQNSNGSAKTLDNVDLLQKKFSNLSLRDNNGLPDDRLPKDGISDEDLSEGTPSKQRCRAVEDAKDVSSRPKAMGPRLEGKDKGKGKARTISQSGDRTEWREQDTFSDSDTPEGNDMRSFNPGQPIRNPSKRFFPTIHLPSTINIDDNVGDLNESNISLQGPDSPAIEAHREESALLKPGRSHQRSKSAQACRHERSDSAGLPTATEVSKSRQSSPGRSTSSEIHKIRRRSTGSLDAAGGASSSANDAPQIDHTEVQAEPASLPKPKKPRASGRRSQGGIDTTQDFPELEHYWTSEKELGGLRVEILEAIKGKPVSKYARVRAIRTGITNMWKAWVDTSGKTPRTPAVEEDGYIYIFKSKPDAFPGSKYVKIGMTKQTPEKRIREWRSKCKLEFEFIHIEDAKDKRFLHNRAVERIVHTELYNERRKYKCNLCGHKHDLELGAKDARRTPTEHGEWFEITEEKALEVVNKWRDWVIKNEPYRPDGSLRTRWEWKCKAASFWMNGTEADWIAWREFNSVENFRYVSLHLKNWLEKIIPPLWEILMARGAIFGLALIWYFWAWGFNFGSCYALLAAVCIAGHFLLKF